MTADRRRTALHEAGHAVAETVFGHAVEYASIRRGKTFHGVNVPLPRDAPGSSTASTRRRRSNPSELRQSVERQIIVYLAGELAALYLDGQTDTPDPPPGGGESTRKRDRPIRTASVTVFAHPQIENIGGLS